MKKKLKEVLVPHKKNNHHPHILRKKALVKVFSLVLGVQVFMLGGAFVLPRLDMQFAAILPSVVTLLTNNARAEGSLPALSQNELLTKAAQAKADDMASKRYFAHQSPDGSQPWDWIKKAGYRYEYAGENLAVNFTDSEEVVKAWQNSPTHNMNLMGPRYTEIGVAFAHGIYEGREATFVVQMFASPARVAPVPVVQKAQSSPEPAPNFVSETQTVAVEPVSSPILGSSIEPSPSWFYRLISSSHTYGMYPIYLLAFFFLAVILAGWGRHHPRALANGAMTVAVLTAVVYMNRYVVFRELDLPKDAEYSATALNSLVE